MATNSEMQPYGATARALHWGTALLVLLAWAVGSTMEEFPRGGSRDLAMQVHYSLGVLVLGFAALRVAWRAVTPPPRVERATWQRLAATGMHLALIVSCTLFLWTPICLKRDWNDDVQHEEDRSSFSR
jgi:cytochrome b561